jgi:hypothetical protein
MLSMENEHSIYEISGIAKFMIFLSERLSDHEYQRVCDLQTEFLDEQLEEHLQQTELLTSYDL